MTIPHEVRIKISWGLIALAALQGAIIIGAMLLGHAKPEPKPDFQWRQPYAEPSYMGESVQSFSPLQQPPPGVDMDAQTELKQAGGCPTGTCPLQRPQYTTTQRPQYIDGERVVAWGPTYTVPQRQPAATPKPAAQQPPTPLLMPAPGGQLTMPAVTNISNPAAQPAGKQFQTLLFVDGSYQGQQLKSWFESDPNLVRFRNGTDYQVFTPDNRLYQARFTSVISPSQFPAIVVQDSTGGHLHAAGKNMIPGTSAELWSDIQKGYTNYKQAKSGLMQMTGAIKTRGYNWDAEINPGMQLAPQDCPDGICPLPNDDQAWRPLDRLRPDRDGGGLFDGGGQRSLFMWAGGSEIVQLGVLLVGVGLLIYILAKRGK